MFQCIPIYKLITLFISAYHISSSKAGTVNKQSSTPFSCFLKQRHKGSYRHTNLSMSVYKLEKIEASRNKVCWFELYLVLCWAYSQVQYIKIISKQVKHKTSYVRLENDLEIFYSMTILFFPITHQKEVGFPIVRNHKVSSNNSQNNT